MSLGRFARALLTVACLLLALPALASAATYTVNSIGDQPDESVGAGGCETAVGNCTLRAAIEESNGSTGVDDQILFSALFNGETLGTIAIGAGFPAITDTATIAGDASGPASGRCATAAGVEGPCVAVSGAPGLDVQAPGVTIRGLAVIEATIGIAVEADAFSAFDNWIGVELDGGAGANGVGLYLAPGSDGAAIGGTEPVDRNVVGNSTNGGLDIEGASETTVLGNYFGVAPDGSTAAGNGVNIEVSDSTAGAGTAAEDTRIGRSVGPAAEITPACDEGCNVISGAVSDGIDLAGSGAGEEPAGGPTYVLGNYLGLGASRLVDAVENGGRAIWVGSASEVRIGGLFNQGSKNEILGGTVGIAAVDAAGLRIYGNEIGDPLGTRPELVPTVAGISVDSGGLAGTEPEVIVTGNRLPLGAGGPDAIVMAGFGGYVTDNLVFGGRRGIWTSGETGGVGNQIYGNSVNYTDEEGILIENDFNWVTLTQVNGAGAAGIRIQNDGADPATGNLVGGDSEWEENWLTANAGAAIEIVDESGSEVASENEVAANWGDSNAGPFIDLGGDGGGNPSAAVNGGIQPPAAIVATESKISGQALPGAVVRVFLKKTTEPGELESLVGSAVADGNGNWTLAFEPRLPALTILAASQTSVAGGSSELAVTGVVSDPAPCPPTANGCSPPVSDTTKPRLTIRKAPKAKSTATTAKFAFSADEAGSRFSCKLDNKPFANCRSPRTYKHLKPGKHVF
jgi:CSLREA domain-containing protein